MQSALHTNSLPLSLQFVSNQGNHSVVKTTYSFLQWYTSLKKLFTAFVTSKWHSWLLRARWMMVINPNQNRQLQHGQKYPPSPTEPRRLEASEAQNHCWIKGIQQVNNEHGYEDHTSMSLDSCQTSSWKKPGNNGGSQTVEFQCLRLSTSNSLQSKITCAQEPGNEDTRYSGLLRHVHTAQCVHQTTPNMCSTEVWSCLDSKSRENWPIAFAVRHPIPILAFLERVCELKSVEDNFSQGGWLTLSP